MGFNEERNQTAREFYTVWKSKYVVKNPYAKDAEQYYIWYSKEKFDFVAAWKPDVYYGDTIKLMVLIGIGGDWWSPYGEK